MVLLFRWNFVFFLLANLFFIHCGFGLVLVLLGFGGHFVFLLGS